MGTILIVDDETGLRRILCDVLEGEGHTVCQAGAGEEALLRFQEVSCDLVPPGHDAPGSQRHPGAAQDEARGPGGAGHHHDRLQRGAGAVEAMKAQAADYLCKPFELDELKLVVQRILDSSTLAHKYRRLQELEEERHKVHQLLGDSRATRQLRHVIRQVAVSEAQSVLIHGESGTGKELVARGLHYGGPRREFPLVGINCAGISEPLFESELFGHERGAFTDAKTAKKGLVEVAHKGTLFLDEIGEMALPLQGEVPPLPGRAALPPGGRHHDIPVEVRVCRDQS